MRNFRLFDLVLLLAITAGAGAGFSARAPDVHVEAAPLLDTRTVERAGIVSLSTTPTRVDCGASSPPRAWRCIDSAAGGVTVYRGSQSVTSATGYPESADAAFGGDSIAYLVLASGTLDVRCTCGE